MSVLPMTVVQADGQNVNPIETDEFRMGVAETYDVIVQLPQDRPYTLFAETMDRSGYARGTIAPRQGMSAEVPKRRRRPMLTMADMGMMHSGMKGMKYNGRIEKHQMHTTVESNGNELPTENLIDQVKHGPDEHGPAEIIGF